MNVWRLRGQRAGSLLLVRSFGGKRRRERVGARGFGQFSHPAFVCPWDSFTVQNADKRNKISYNRKKKLFSENELCNRENRVNQEK